MLAVFTKICNQAGWNKRVGRENCFEFLIEQAKKSVSRVVKILKIVREHAFLLGTKEYLLFCGRIFFLSEGTFFIC